MKTDIQSLLPQNQIEEIKIKYLNGAHWQDVLSFTNEVLDALDVHSQQAEEGAPQAAAQEVVSGWKFVPIYQTRWGNPETVWGDVDKATYDDFESFGYAVRRIVYASAPAPVSAPSPDREQAGEAETEQSIAADSYFWIAERIGTLDGYSVQDHVDIGWKVLQDCSDYFHDFVGSDEGGDDVAVRIAADLRAVLNGRLEQVEAKGVCQRCGGIGVVDDGEIVGVGGWSSRMAL